MATCTYYCSGDYGLNRTVYVSIAVGADFTPASWVPSFDYYYLSSTDAPSTTHTVTGDEAYSASYIRIQYTCTYYCYDETSGELIGTKSIPLVAGYGFTPSASQHIPSIDGYSYDYIYPDPGSHIVESNEQYDVYYMPPSSVWIYTGTNNEYDGWQRAIPYIYTSNGWQKARAYIYTGSGPEDGWQPC